MVVVENVVSSLFNSHLFDFASGWLYVFGVGVVGGMVLRQGHPAGRDDAGGGAMVPIAIPADARILVVALRRLGDVLLTTPLMRSLKRAYPASARSTRWCSPGPKEFWRAIRISPASS